MSKITPNLGLVLSYHMEWPPPDTRHFSILLTAFKIKSFLFCSFASPHATRSSFKTTSDFEYTWSNLALYAVYQRGLWCKLSEAACLFPRHCTRWSDCTRSLPRLQRRRTRPGSSLRTGKWFRTLWRDWRTQPTQATLTPAGISSNRSAQWSNTFSVSSVISCIQRQLSDLIHSASALWSHAFSVSSVI